MVLSEINDKKLKIYTNLANVAALYTSGVNDELPNVINTDGQNKITNSKLKIL